MSPAPRSSRHQVTLFVPGPASSVLEAIRQRLDPVQYRLIAAHVTLCREDELASVSVASLEDLPGVAQHPPLTLDFGPPEVFAGHGVRMPCIAGEAPFHRLRGVILGSDDIRMHRAHITLAHPRNPRAPDNVPEAYASLGAPLAITFSRVSLIEQLGQEPWQVRRTIDLVASAA